MSEAPFTCPCCGFRTLTEGPGSYEICHVCYWEDDGVQLLDPAYRGGANKPSLMEGQANYKRTGASEERFIENVRSPAASEVRDAEWRPVEESDLRYSRTPTELSVEEYRSVDAWYYWKRRAT